MPALPGQGDGQGGLGHGVHGRRHASGTRSSMSADAGGGVDLGGEDVAPARHDEDVVEGEGLEAGEQVVVSARSHQVNRSARSVGPLVDGSVGGSAGNDGRVGDRGRCPPGVQRRCRSLLGQHLPDAGHQQAVLHGRGPWPRRSPGSSPSRKGTSSQGDRPGPLSTPLVGDEVDHHPAGGDASLGPGLVGPLDGVEAGEGPRLGRMEVDHDGDGSGSAGSGPGFQPARTTRSAPTIRGLVGQFGVVVGPVPAPVG